MAGLVVPTHLALRVAPPPPGGRGRIGVILFVEGIDDMKMNMGLLSCVLAVGMLGGVVSCARLTPPRKSRPRPQET